MKMHAFTLLMFAYILSFSKSQIITLYDFRQEDSNSQCTNGLLRDTDRIVYNCTVDYSHDTQAKYVIFQTKGISKDRFEFFTDCAIQDDCKGSKYIEGIHVGRNIINMTINVEAKQSFSQAYLRGNLYTSDSKEVISSERMIPYISDVADANLTLIVNGHGVSTSQECSKNVSGGELNIIFLCESEVSPCLIEISTDDSNETSQGAGHATWNKEYPSQTEVNVLIKYAFCNFRGKFQSVSCNFTIDNKSTTEEISCSDNKIPFSLLSALAAVLTCVLIFLSRKRILQLFSKRDPRDTLSKKHDVIGQNRPTFDLEDRALLHESPGQYDCHQLETSVDLGMDHSPRDSHSESTRKRYIDTSGESEACTASELQNLMQDFMSCQKKEKHEHFIPIDKFSKNDLPLKCDTTDLFDLIKCTSELTVKVTVNYISTKRPGFYPGTHYTYPFHQKRGTYLTRLGTGLVNSVTLTENQQTCPCYKCLTSGNASKVWGKICIATAKSLVFDDSEAQKTTFKINFDEENGIYPYVEGLRVTQSDIDTDQCEVECVTCDEGILNLLYLKPNTCRRKMAKFNSKYNQYEEKDNLTIIVSHPHGCPKHVSIGHWTKRLVFGNDGSRQYTKYVYTTPTCPGCIGAFIYILGASDIALKHHIHCGVNEEMNNFSSTGMEKICTETKNESQTVSL